MGSIPNIFTWKVGNILLKKRKNDRGLLALSEFWIGAFDAHRVHFFCVCATFRLNHRSVQTVLVRCYSSLSINKRNRRVFSEGWGLQRSSWPELGAASRQEPEAVWNGVIQSVRNQIKLLLIWMELWVWCLLAPLMWFLAFSSSLTCWWKPGTQKSQTQTHASWKCKLEEVIIFWIIRFLIIYFLYHFFVEGNKNTKKIKTLQHWIINIFSMLI